MQDAKRSLIYFCLCFLLFTFPPLAAAKIEPNPSLSPFPVPASLESSVEFWKRVFSEFSISQVIYFDPLDLSKIYEVADIGEERRSNEYFNEERARIAAASGVDIERVKVQRGVKEKTAAGLKRSGRYISQIKRIFAERGLPTQLTYLPIVESSYDINARSSVGALGIWQFMPRTGRQYLRMARGIDERKDPLESSRAAAAYLKQAYDNLGNWPLAVTSYNFGQAGMARAVEEVGSTNLVDLIERHDHPYWGFPPKQFYAEFLAALEIGTNLKRYFPDLSLDAPVEIKETEVTRNTALASLIRSSGLNRNQFLGWNPALSASLQVVPAGYRVKLPSNRSVEPLVVLAKNEVAESKPRAQVVHHRVKPGETLYEIARRYGASVQQIAQLNGLQRAHLLRVGSTLRIPRM